MNPVLKIYIITPKEQFIELHATKDLGSKVFHMAEELSRKGCYVEVYKLIHLKNKEVYKEEQLYSKGC